MSRQIHLDREVTRCEDCEIFKECSNKSLHTHGCQREALKNIFETIFNDDTEEDDDL